MTATAALASITAANAAISSANAHRAMVERCKGVVSNYNASTASVERAREYASCVSALYPDPPTAADVLGLKIAIVLAIVGFFIGGARGWKELEDGFGLVVGSILGAILLPMVVGFVCAIAYGAYWVVTK